MDWIGFFDDLIADSRRMRMGLNKICHDLIYQTRL